MDDEMLDNSVALRCLFVAPTIMTQPCPLLPKEKDFEFVSHGLALSKSTLLDLYPTLKDRAFADDDRIVDYMHKQQLLIMESRSEQRVMIINLKTNQVVTRTGKCGN